MKTIKEQNILSTVYCNITDYSKILHKQLELHKQRYEGEIDDIIILTEHPAVITLGANKSLNKLLVNKDKLNGIDIIEIKRGGGITAHNPGQLVCYPILNLKKLNLGINEYIRTLEQIGIELLGQLEVTAVRKNNFPGLWVDNKKIASIGVRVSKGITFHGMAININNDLGIFKKIVPCGIDGVEMTSVLKETGKNIPMQIVKDKLSKLLIKHFSRAEQ